MDKHDLQKLIFTDQMFAFVEIEWNKFRTEVQMDDNFVPQMVAEYLRGGSKDADIMKLLEKMFAAGISVGCMRGAELALTEVEKAIRNI